MAMMTETRTQGISARRYIGKDVMDPSGQKIGEIDDLILHSMNGCVQFAIVDEGGFLGMGQRHHAVPWKAITWSPDTNQLMVSFTRDKLTAAPLLDRNNPPDWTNETWQRTVYDYYGIQYEGMGGGMGMGGMGGESMGGGGMGGGGMGGGGMGGGGMGGTSMGGGGMGGRTMEEER